MKICNNCGKTGDENFYVSVAHLCTPCLLAERAEKRKRPEHKRYAFEYHLKDKYGLTLEEYAHMVKDQDNRCGICSIEMDPPCVDHCHAEGHVRGLLCHHCNKGIGFFRDDPDTLTKAATYLQ